MDGKEYFIQCCKELNIECEKYFALGEGKTYTNKGKNQKPRYVHTVKNNKDKSNIIYAVKYYKCSQLYIAWDFKRKSKEIFSIIAEDARKAIGGNNIGVCEKYIESITGDKELVYVFRKNGIKDFLDRVLNE